MTNKRSRRGTAGLDGAITAAVAAQREDVLSMIVETVGGYFGGAAASRLSDVAASPRRRSAVEGELLRNGASLLANIVSESGTTWMREKSLAQRAIWRDASRPWWERLLAFLADMALRFTAGALRAFGGGEGGVPTLDAVSARRLPAIA